MFRGEPLYPSLLSKYSEAGVVLNALLVPGLPGALLVLALSGEPAYAATPQPATPPQVSTATQTVAHVQHRALAQRPATDQPTQHFSAYLHPAGLLAYAPADYVTAQGRSLVALSFDDGPDPVNTPKVLDTLREAGVHATFFLIGLHIERDPDRARQIVSEGHEVGPHGYRHRDMARMTDDALRVDMAAAMASLRAVAPQAPITWFRPPQGACDGRVLAEAARFGLDTIRWDVDPSDWKEGRTASEVTEAVLSHLHPGAVVLLHSVRSATAEALPTILREGAARGYQFVTVSEWWAAARRATAALPAERGRRPPDSGGEVVPAALAR